MNNRRKLVIALGAGALTAPLAAEAQQAGQVSRIGYLSSGSPSNEKPRDDAFRQSLRQLGYFEGKNVVIEYRYADGKLTQLPDLAAELVTPQG